jgi:hypothetical protein
MVVTDNDGLPLYAGDAYGGRFLPVELFRVAIPAYSDAYAAGERTGTVLESRAGGYTIDGDTGINGTFGIRDAKGALVTIGRVKLDRSGAVKPFILDDCVVL